MQYHSGRLVFWFLTKKMWSQNWLHFFLFKYKGSSLFWGVTKMMIGKGAPKSLVTRCDLKKKNPSQVSQVNQRGKKHGRKIFLLSPLIGNTPSETLCQLLNPKAQLWKQSIEIAMAPKNISVFIMCFQIRKELCFVDSWN